MKRIIALVVAMLMIASLFVACTETPADEEGATTTTTTTTTKTTTTKPEEIEDPEVNTDPETPVTGDAWLDWHNSMQTVPGLNPMVDLPVVWNDGAPENVFDGIDGIINTNDAGGTKLGGGNAPGTVVLEFEAPDSKLIAYTLVTGNDSGKEVGRTPGSWTLYGYNETDDEWVVIDDVYDGAMEELDHAPFGYTIDTDKQGTYSSYKFEFTFGISGTLSVLQLNEIYLYVEAAPAA